MIKLKEEKKKSNKEFFCENLGWKIIFHYIGYFGMLNLLYWLIQYMSYLGNQEEDKFFSIKFYKINYIFGWIYGIIFILILINKMLI